MFNYFSGFYRKLKRTVHRDSIRKAYGELLTLIRRIEPLSKEDIEKIQSLMYVIHGEQTLVRRKFRAFKDAVEYKKLLKENKIIKNDVSYAVGNKIVEGEIKGCEEEAYIMSIAPAIKYQEQMANINNSNSNESKAEKKACHGKHCEECYKKQIKKELQREMELEARAKTEERKRRIKKAKVRNLNKFSIYNERLGLPRVVGMAMADEYFDVEELDSEDREAYNAWIGKKNKLKNKNNIEKKKVKSLVEESNKSLANPFLSMAKEETSMFYEEKKDIENPFTQTFGGNKDTTDVFESTQEKKDEPFTLEKKNVENPFATKTGSTPFQNNPFILKTINKEEEPGKQADKKEETNDFKNIFGNKQEIKEETKNENPFATGNTTGFGSNIFGKLTNEKSTNEAEEKKDESNKPENIFGFKKDESIKPENIFGFKKDEETKASADKTSEEKKPESIFGTFTNPFEKNVLDKKEETTNATTNDKGNNLFGFGTPTNNPTNVFGSNNIFNTNNTSTSNIFENNSAFTTNNTNNPFASNNVNNNFSGENIFQGNVGKRDFSAMTTDNSQNNDTDNGFNPFDINNMNNNNTTEQFNPFANGRNNPFSNSPQNTDMSNASTTPGNSSGIRRRRARRK